MKFGFVKKIPGDAKPVPGFRGIYCDMRGRIFSLRLPGKIRRLNVQANDLGYLYSSVRIENDKIFQLFISRAIMLTHFYKKGCEQLLVDHINCNVTDNRPKNLRWVTAKENASNVPHRCKGESRPGARLSEKDVKHMRQLKNVSYSQMARIYGISSSTARNAVLGIKWKHVK